MNLFLTLLLALPLSGPVPAQPPTSPQHPSPTDILTGVSHKLHSLEKFQYDNTRELNYASENYHNTSTWTVFYDFTPADTLVGFKYQMEDAIEKEIFNGAEKFTLDKNKKTIQINDHPNKKDFSSLSFLYNSITTLKNILPLLIDDHTVTTTAGDTTIDDTHYIRVTLNTGRRRIQNLGQGFDQMKTHFDFMYTLLIRPADSLPYQIIQFNNDNTDFIKTTFTHIQTSPAAPGELSWYYSTYTNEYKQARNDAPSEHPLAAGAPAPSWQLHSYTGDKIMSSDQLKGQVVLLDFWIKNCGPCIESVPHLNQLQKKFRDLHIISINAYDPPADISWFCQKHNIQYPVLSNGRTVAKDYGVGGFPTFFIIDRSGRICYTSSGYGESAQSTMEQVIKKALSSDQQ